LAFEVFIKLIIKQTLVREALDAVSRLRKIISIIAFDTFSCRISLTY